jgi:hypothetical protein
MHLFARSVKVGSLGLCTAVLALAGLAPTACVITTHDDDDHHWDDDGHHWDDDGTSGGTTTPPPEVEPMLVAIDTDATISTDAGEGVGLFVEYAAGGTWLVWTTCDTNYSNAQCAFDVLVTVDTASEITSVDSQDLEGSDTASRLDSASAAMTVSTGSEFDAMVVSTTPGAILRLEMALDGSSEPRFIYWFGEGVLHEGAPTNPIDFEPTEP